MKRLSATPPDAGGLCSVVPGRALLRDDLGTGPAVVAWPFSFRACQAQERSPHQRVHRVRMHHGAIEDRVASLQAFRSELVYPTSRVRLEHPPLAVQAHERGVGGSGEQL